MDAAGKVALVTGAGSGIGRATARLLAERGATVAVADVDERGGEETVASIGGAASFVRLDVTSLADWRRTLDRVVAEHGGLHVLHNNAGIVVGHPDFPDCPAETVAAVVAVNVTGTLAGTTLAIGPIAASGGGAIVNMSSTLALATEHRDPVYAATKAAVLQFTRLSAPLAFERGVRISCILPGGVDTPIIGKTGASGEPAAWMRERLGEIELIPPERIAATVLELVEDESRWGDAVEIRR